MPLYNVEINIETENEELENVLKDDIYSALRDVGFVIDYLEVTKH